MGDKSSKKSSLLCPCFPPSSKKPAATAKAPAPAPAPKIPKEVAAVTSGVAATTIAAAGAAAATTSTPAMAKILIIYYSTWGHIKQLADQVKAGIESIPGVTAELWQVPETLPEEVLTKMHAAPKGSDPVLTHDKLDVLKSADGFIFGIPTRYGSPAAQVKTFFDSTGALWQAGALVGKAGAFFFSTGTQGGGQETTALTALPNLVHHGIIYVPTGYSFGPAMFDLTEAHGGSPWGAGTLAGADGSRQPSKYELDYAKHQGSYFAGVVKKLAAK